jgi:hypothetical protein
VLEEENESPLSRDATRNSSVTSTTKTILEKIKD